MIKGGAVTQHCCKGDIAILMADAKLLSTGNCRKICHKSSQLTITRHRRVYDIIHCDADDSYQFYWRNRIRRHFFPMKYTTFSQKGLGLYQIPKIFVSLLACPYPFHTQNIAILPTLVRCSPIPSIDREPFLLSFERFAYSMICTAFTNKTATHTAFK